MLCSLEVLDEQGNLKRKADMFTRRTIRPHVAVTSVDTASEALAVSISEKARVDMDYMACLLYTSKALTHPAPRNPFFPGILRPSGLPSSLT